MEEAGRLFASMDIELQSGAADGADKAFERGCDAACGRKRIRLPWRGFNGYGSGLFDLPEEAFRIAEAFHPAWKNLTPAAKKLMARSSFQILPDLQTPVDFVLCYTEGGSGNGGTGQALRIARHYTVPIFDFGLHETFDDAAIRLELRRFLGTEGIPCP